MRSALPRVIIQKQGMTNENIGSNLWIAKINIETGYPAATMSLPKVFLSRGNIPEKVLQKVEKKCTIVRQEGDKTDR